MEFEKIPPPKKGSGKKWQERRLGMRAQQAGKAEDEQFEGILTVDSSTYEAEVLKSELPVVLEFFTVYCPPCREIEPTLEKFAREYAGKVKIARIRMDTNADISRIHDVSVAPTIVVIKDGRPLGRKLLGPVPEEAITNLLERELGVC